MCTLTFGWKMLVIFVVAFYSFFMLACGAAIEAGKREDDDKAAERGIKFSFFIIAVVCIIVWFLLS